MQPKHGDIVLIPIPFTDLSAQKQRPVVVISNDDYNHTAPDYGRCRDDFESDPWPVQLSDHLSRFGTGEAQPSRNCPCR